MHRSLLLKNVPPLCRKNGTRWISTVTCALSTPLHVQQHNFNPAAKGEMCTQHVQMWRGSHNVQHQLRRRSARHFSRRSQRHDPMSSERERLTQLVDEGDLSEEWVEPERAPEWREPDEYAKESDEEFAPQEEVKTKRAKYKHPKRKVLHLAALQQEILASPLNKLVPEENLQTAVNCNKVLWECYDYKAYEVMEDIFNYMMKNHISPNNRTFGCMMKRASKLGHIDQLLYWFTKGCQMLAPDDYMFGQVLSAASRMNDMDVIAELITSMKKEKITPTQATFQTLINSAANTKNSEMLHFALNWMAIESDGYPDIQLFTSILSAFLALGDITRARKMCATARSRGFLSEKGGSGDGALFRVMMQTFAQSGDAVQLRRVWRDMQTAGFATGRSLGLYLKGLGSCDNVEMLATEEKKFLDGMYDNLMEDSGELQLDYLRVWTALIGAYLQLNHTVAVWELLYIMLAGGKRKRDPVTDKVSDELDNTHVPVDRTLIATLINAHLTHQIARSQAAAKYKKQAEESKKPIPISAETQMRNDTNHGLHEMIALFNAVGRFRPLLGTSQSDLVRVNKLLVTFLSADEWSMVDGLMQLLVVSAGSGASLQKKNRDRSEQHW
eukprot:TRINITY_DN68120_c1_g8_i1.p1 TRINITY_DN68120_c1_g8~~TRINITY_DN68120_c1_g8_i1.p1  ORF type:complete len:613 (-),score=47.07 TRINITY_DN68120_c1_g8_i1:772-2610(-)